MYTQCPACKTVFNVKPEQLRAARGKVRCSRCQTIFNAAEHSYTPDSSPSTPTKPAAVTASTKPSATKPQPAPQKKASTAKPQAKQQANTEATKPAAKQPAQKKPAPEPKPVNKPPPTAAKSDDDGWFDLTPTPSTKPETPKKTPAAPPTQAAKAKTATKAQEEQSPNDNSVADELNDDLFQLFAEKEVTEAITLEETAPATPEAPEAPAEKAETPTGEDKKASTKEEPAQEKKKAREGNYSLPPQLEARPVRATMRTLTLMLSNLMLVSALAMQYAYSHRIPLRENETLRPWLDTLCQLTSCPLPPQRDLDKIELVDNMMQSHPRYKDSLLITATLINRANYVQPYPIVEITMSDLQQKVVAKRTFRPEEYLAGDIAEMGFTPNVEVAMMLEVADPGNNAVGFKFDFY